MKKNILALITLAAFVFSVFPSFAQSGTTQSGSLHIKRPKATAESSMGGAIKIGSKKDNSNQAFNAVDNNIPLARKTNKNVRVMIICNQDYTEEQPVTTALNDGRVLSKYCTLTLGIPEKQVELLENRTSAQMRRDVRDFTKTMMLNEDCQFLFFYFGHGMHSADPQNNDAYLIPIDGSSESIEYDGISRKWMMSQFDSVKPKQLVVCLESCFSGSTGDNTMLSYAHGSSGLRLEDAVENNFNGNIVLITASSGRETASAHPYANHNIFTYEFLRLLNESQGDIDLGTLFETVKRRTAQTAHNELHRNQTPSIVVPNTLGDNWRKWRLVP